MTTGSTSRSEILLPAAAVASLPFSRAFDPVLGLISLGLALLLLARLGDRLARRLAPDAPAAERLGLAFGLAAVLATGLVYLLGSIGILRWPLFVAAAALLVPASHIGGRSDEAPQRVPPWAAAALSALFAIVLASGLFAGSGHAARYTPPGAVHYDDVSYHLPAAATWLRHGDLRMLRFEFGDPSTAFYPPAGEALAWVLLAPLSSDFLARWAQLPAAIGALFLLWALTRRAGGTPWASALAVALALSVPAFVPAAAFAAGNDLWAAYWLLAILLAATRFACRPGLVEALLVGLAGGAFVGVKYFSLLVLPAALALSAVVLGRPLETLRRAPRAGAMLAAIAGGAIFGGGFPYLRNLLLTGNPVFPQPVSIAGFRLFEGWDAAALAVRIQAASFSPRLGAFHERQELLGPIWKPLFLVAMVALPVVAALVARWRPGVESRCLLALALLPGALLLTYVLFSPDRRDLRYVLAAPLAAGAALAAVIARFPRGWRAAIWCALAGSTLYVAGSSSPRASTAIAVAALVAVATFAGFARGARLPRFAGALLLVGGLAALAPTARRYHELRDRHEPGAVALARVAAGRPATVAYVGGNRPHFYFGPRLANTVEIVPASGDLDARFFGDRPLRAESPSSRRRARTWLRNLEALAVDFVVIDGEGLASGRADWLLRADSPFELAREGAGYQIWRRRSSRGSLAAR